MHLTSCIIAKSSCLKGNALEATRRNFVGLKKGRCICIQRALRRATATPFFQAYNNENLVHWMEGGIADKMRVRVNCPEAFLPSNRQDNEMTKTPPSAVFLYMQRGVKQEAGNFGILTLRYGNS